VNWWQHLHICASCNFAVQCCYVCGNHTRILILFSYKCIIFLLSTICFLFNAVFVLSFPRAYQKESFFQNVQYIDGPSIITSLSYPLTAMLDYDILWIVNFVPGRFAKFVFTNVSLSEVCIRFFDYWNLKLYNRFNVIK
jgi:hypothetical protein